MQKTQHVTGRSLRVRAVSLLLAAALTLGLLPGVPGLVGTARAHWADDYLSQLVEWGVIRSDQTGNPDQALTRADFMAITNRAYGYHEPGPTPFTDVEEDDWFYDDVGIAYNAKYILGTSPTTASPNDTLTRETAATVLGRNMMLQESPGELLDFTDARDISSWAHGTVKASLEHYLIGGYDDGTFRPQKEISWGEMAAMLTRIIGTPLQEEGDYALGGVYGNVTITSPGVTLRDSIISGDLYITGGVGLGDVKLENVTVLGRIIASGGGESESGQASILLRNVTADELLVDNLNENTVTVQADGITEIGRTTVRTNAYIEDNTPDGMGLKYISLEGTGEEEGGLRLDVAGRIEEVVNKTPNSLVQAAKGTVKKLTVDEAATDSDVLISRGAVVKELNLDTATDVTGEGDITKLVVNAPGCTVEQLPDEIIIRPGITAIIHGEEMDAVGAEESTLDPLILAGYPEAADVAPTSVEAIFATNKKGTVYWGVSDMNDGSIATEDLIKNPTYGSIAVKNGNVAIPKGNDEVSVRITGLKPGTNYYLSAVLVDDRGVQSPTKVVSFTTPDDSVPAFANGYPYMSTVDTPPTMSQVVVMPTKDCKLYYALLPAGAQQPTEEEFRNASVSGALGYGVMDVTKNVETIFGVNDVTLEEQTTYDLYLWLVDADGMNKGAVTKLSFTTSDETPPYFTMAPTVNKVANNSVGLTFGLSEPGTVYWAVVEEGTDYPKPRPGMDQSSVDLNDEYSILQIISGLGALKNGSVRVSGNNLQGNINVTGLEPEKSYVLYYVAQDTAGNYSVGVEYLTIHTEDEGMPIVKQRFSDYNGDQTKDPLPDTDIILEFSENVRYDGTGGGEGFVQLYEKVKTSTGTEKEDAIRDLATSLAGAIWLYQQGDEPKPVKVTVNTEPVKENQTKDWVLDFTQAKVENINGKVEVTIPKSAVNLDSGGIYYFEIHDVTDTSLKQNKIEPNPAGHDDDSVKAGHVLPVFTTVFAQVSLRQFAITDLPKDAQGNDVPVDFAFRATPVSTEKVADGMGYDFLMWADRDMYYDLYIRVNGEKTWQKINNSSLSIPAQDETLGGKSLNLDFYTRTASQIPALNTFEKKGYEFAVSVTRLEDSDAEPTERSSWTGDVNFYVDVSAGTRSNLNNLATGLTRKKWDDFQANGIANNGGASIGSIQGGGKELQMKASFSDTRLPEFITPNPFITPSDTSAEIDVQMTRAGTIYWVAAPVGVIHTAADIGSGGGEKINEELKPYIPESGPYPEPPVPAVRLPGNMDIYRQGYNNPRIKKGVVNYGGNGEVETIIPKDLEPSTDYYVYFVLRGSSQNLSPVYVYKFTTAKVDRPRITLDHGGVGVVDVSTDKDSVLNYVILTSTELKKAAEFGDSYMLNDHSKFPVPSAYSGYTVLKALIEPYNSSISGDTNFGPEWNGYSIFDVYASDNVKNSIQNYIRQNFPTSQVLSKETFRLDANISQKTKTDGMKPNDTHYILAVAHHKNTDQGLAYDSYRAQENIVIPDTVAPKLVGKVSTVIIKQEGTDPTTATVTGTVSFGFDKPVYWSADRSSGSATPVVNREGGGSGWMSITADLGGSATGLKVNNPTNNQTSAASSFSLSFTNLKLNSTIVLFNSGWIANSSGNSDEKKLTLRLVYGPIDNPNNLELNGFYFVVDE
ncbi:MAG: S-layer homology domain-containing protein [Oscillospiraceae bacterium]|jgi:hypothetical protein|nr:S-layer homology domain-containing protein [Oscillospiraceae bacterium]